MTKQVLQRALDALKYARRMVNASECDSAYIDAAIAELRAAIDAPEVGAVAWMDCFGNVNRVKYRGFTTPLAPQSAVDAKPAGDWTVINSGGAEVASKLTYADAMKYMTTDRIERGWTAVGVVNKESAAHGIAAIAQGATP
jgi:hypothetical protein